MKRTTVTPSLTCIRSILVWLCLVWAYSHASVARALDHLPSVMCGTFGGLRGEALGAHFGNTVASAGDVNGDGLADVLVGDYGYDALRGRAYLFLGSNVPDLFSAPKSPFLILTGENTADNMGTCVASAGDVNGDGYDDILVGAPNYSVGGANKGRVYVYFGGPAMDNVADLTLTGEIPGSFFGYSVASVGDLNHDGFDDFAVGAHGFASGTDSERGRVYVYYGGTTPDATPDLKITGRNNGDRFGFAVASGGDVNGDGIGDFIVGAPGYSSLAGRAYLFLGSAMPDTIEDQVYTGEATGNWFGTSVSSAGDVNADGYADLVVGAPNYSLNKGRAYIYRGASKPGNVASLVMTGENEGDYFGFCVASLGDANRDGVSDVVVGAPLVSQYGGTGKVYVFFEAATSNSTLYGIGPVVGAALQNGWSVAGAGDVDGDGYPDLIYGSPGQSPFGVLPAPTGAATVESIFPYRVVQPNGGEQWIVGQKATLKWRGNAEYPTDVWLSQDGGATWTLLLGGVSESAPINFCEHEMELTVPGPATASALIRLSHSGLPISPSTSDVSDTVFQIVNPTPPSTIAMQTNSPKISTLGQAAFDGLGLSLAGGSDWNGDGFADVAIAAPSSPGAGSAGHVSVYWGGAKADGIADVVLNGQTVSDEFGQSVAFVGDLNGDGFADLAVGAPLNDAAGADAGRVYIYFGGPSADAVADLTINGLAAGTHFGAIVAPAGDVNGDHIADLLVGTGSDVGAGTTYVFFGGPSMDTVADLTLYEGPGFGTWSTGLGDVNGDGYSDVLVGSPSLSGGKGKAYLYYGGTSPNPVADAVLSGGSSFGQAVAAAGDLNQDGFADFIVGEPDASRAVVFLGGPSLDSGGNLVLSGSSGGGFGTAVAGVGDLNGDSYPDIAVGEPFSSQAGPGMGRVRVFFGGSGMDGIADATIATTAFGNGGVAGYRVARAGDFLGDGFSDLLVGAPGASINGNLSGGAALYDVNRFQLQGPNGGETWQVGASKTISWYGSEPADLLLSTDGGNSYTTFASNVGGKAFNSLGILVPHTPTKFARVKLVPRDLVGTPPSPIGPPNLIVPPSPVVPPSPIVAGGDQSDSLFTINASVSLLALLAAPAPAGAGAVITWNTDPGPDNLAGYRLEKSTSGGPWRTLVAMTKEVRVEDPEAAPASRYRLFSVDGLNEELYLGETSFRLRAPLAAWPLPYRGGKLSISFATSGGLGGAAGPADVGIFDVQGRLVRHVTQGTYPAGYQSAEWDGRDDRGQVVGSGIYLIRSMSGGSRTSVKLVVAR